MCVTSQYYGTAQEPIYVHHLSQTDPSVISVKWASEALPFKCVSRVNSVYYRWCCLGVSFINLEISRALCDIRVNLALYLVSCATDKSHRSVQSYYKDLNINM